MMIEQTLLLASMGTNIFYGFCVLILLYHVANGWSDGLGRKLFSLLAIAGAILGGYFLGWMPVPFLETRFPLHPTLINGIGSSLMGFVCYLSIKIAGLIFTKRTKDHEGLSKTLSGIGGGLLGLGVGVVWLYLILTGLRFVNNLVNSDISPTAVSNEDRGFIGEILNDVEEVVEEGPLKKIYSTVDPITPDIYRMTAKSAHILRNSEAKDSFINSPEVQSLIRDPLFTKYANDSEIRPLLENKEFKKIVTHPKTADLIKDPSFTKLIKEYDLENAMDRAIADMGK
jgi:hypothetical protein